MKKVIFTLFVISVIAFNGISQSSSTDVVTATQIGNTGQYASLVTGPDGKFYGLYATGEIDRWTMDANGKLINFKKLPGVSTSCGSDCSAIGLTFAPNSTRANPVAFVIYSTFNNGFIEDNKMSKLSGINLQEEQLMLTDLSSSVIDHLKRTDGAPATQIVNTNQYASIITGPDGKFYGLHATGEVDRWILDTDGKTSNFQTLRGVSDSCGSDCSAIGLTFSPNATAANPVAFIIYSTFNNGFVEDSKMAQLSGMNLQKEQLILNDLSSSVVAHLDRNRTDYLADPGSSNTALAFAQSEELTSPSFQIAPNSTKDLFSVNIQAEKAEAHRLVIMDNSNNVHYEKSFAGNKKEVEIEINSADLEAGIYYVIVENEINVDAQQLIVYK